MFKICVALPLPHIILQHIVAITSEFFLSLLEKIDIYLKSMLRHSGKENKFVTYEAN